MTILFYLVASPVKIKNPWSAIRSHRVHLDHSSFFPQSFKTPQDVTRACLKCHDRAAKEVMKTVHWTWESEPVDIPAHKEPLRIGKKNLLNNFCLGIQGNWAVCCSCHAGYGWENASYDFNLQENVDCLICHDWSGNYGKGDKGLPQPGVDLLAAARSVGYPKRQICAICHVYGGGGMGVKHGDLDESLVNASENLDVHMGRLDLLCVDCHITKEHFIRGTAYSVSVNADHGIACTDCHSPSVHRDERLNRHVASVACNTCHIPTFARKAPTKMAWDWSKAGDGSRADDPHHYLKIKGEFVYQQDVIPDYAWFNRRTGRYILGDHMDPEKTTVLNPPQGSISDPDSRIWPFKIHRAKQPYDKTYRYFLMPVLSGQDGGYWYFFDWDRAFKSAEKFTGLKYSGAYGFAETAMYWPVSHMISPAAQALHCNDCHGSGRFDWQALGYRNDPEKSGGRQSISRQGEN